MEQRERFIADLKFGLFSVLELCARYGVSRKTGYKWIERFEEEGRHGLGDRSRAPKTCPHRIDPLVARTICDARRRHTTWGPKKILQWMELRFPAMSLPAVSTAGDLLVRRGLVKKRRRRHTLLHPGVVPAVTTAPNDIWAVDFKGQFKTRDGIYCYPLTITDLHSRSLLVCHGLLSTKAEGVFPVFDRAFREFGLPKAIRTDNGVPFATTGIHGLSQLNVWWIRLGIQHQRILPASPQQNGKHERMHKTLKAEATIPPCSNMHSQQKKFDSFQNEFNHERPHDALGGKTPASLYAVSNRPYDGKIPPYEYPAHFIIKRVTNAGTFRLKDHLLFIANALKQNLIGLEETDDGIWSIYLCNVLLARLDERDFIIRG
jgi:transposase InsO family protein